jgi:hypothetical protein
MANAPRSAVIAMRLPSEAKARFAALAARHQLTESGLLSKLVDEVLHSNVPIHGTTPGASGTSPGTSMPRAADIDPPSEDRITLRLRHGDRSLAVERADARGMKTATYLALLIHNHVRTSDVLPPKELDLLKTAGAQLAALGRVLRMFDMPNTSDESVASELRDLLTLTRLEVESARAATAAVVRRNLMSWEASHA